MKRIGLSLTAGALLIGVLTGCHDAKKEQSQKEKVTQQWNNARAGVVFAIAKQQFEGGDFDKCRQSLADTLKMEPRFVPALILQARVAIEQGQLELAEKALQ